MGYYSEFDIHIDAKDKSDELLDRLIEISDYSFEEASSVDSSSYTYSACDTIKWYDHEEDMTQLSIEFPKVLFTLDGLGEDNEQWRTYFKNGNVQDVEVKTVYGKQNMRLLNKKIKD